MSAREIMYRDALREALDHEMGVNPAVFIIGEGIAERGGSYKVTEGLLNKYGPDRVRDTPISEASMIGAGVGAAIAGARPITEILYIDFAMLGMDQIVNQAAKFRLMTGDRGSVPFVMRTQGGAGGAVAAQHSQSLEALFYHIPGLRVVMPSTPYDAKGLLTHSLRQDHPVMFLEHKHLYMTKGMVPEEDYEIEFGKAEVMTEGDDVTIVAWSHMLLKAMEAAETLAAENIQAEVINLRTLSPLDADTIMTSVAKTNRVVIAQEAVRRGGVASDIASYIHQKEFYSLDAPIEIVAGLNIPIPFNLNLEKASVPQAEDIVDAAKRTLEHIEKRHLQMQHVLEKLAATNPASEIWWDSSPLIYGKWADGVLKSAPEDKLDLWSEQLSRLLDPATVASSGEMGFRGVTTNPPLSLQAIKGDPDRWVSRIRALCNEEPSATVEEVYWKIYLEVVRDGAAMIRSVWDASNGLYGFVSGQVDPRCVTDYDAMLEQALSIAAQGPNIMVKAPGSMQGYQIIEEMTARGISTNNTTSFSMPQYVACMDAVSRGLERAKANNVDLSRWRSVITHMSARLTGLGDMLDQAALRGIEISPDEAQLAELAVMKRAYRHIRDTGHPSKMLMCSMRVNKDDGQGGARSLHIEKLAGGDFVYTCPPSYISALMDVEDRLPAFDPNAINEELPADLYDRLMRIPFFRQAYEPDGMEPHQFAQFGPFIATAGEFAKATRQTIDFVAHVMEGVKHG